MRKGIGFLLLLLLFSCANNNFKETKIINADSDLLEYEAISENLTFEKLASEKLQDYFELLKLENEHPKFKEDILLQLKNFSNEKLTTSNDFSIENIRKKGSVVSISDSIQNVKLYYDIVLDNHTVLDSINAVLTTKTILLDGLETKSTKITFSLIAEN